MSTSVALPLMDAIKENDFITASRFLKEHWEKLTLWGENSYYLNCPPGLRICYWKMKALLKDDRYMNVLFRDPSKSEIWNLLLHISCFRGDVKFTELLLTKGVSATKKLRNYNSTPLHSAVYGHHPKIVHRLLKTDPSCVNIKGEFGRTALNLAVIENRIEIVNLLLKYDADETLIDDYGCTVFHEASWPGRNDIVECLLKRSRSAINIRDNSGATALLAAVINGHINIAKQLLNTNEIANVYDQHKAHSCLTFAEQEPIARSTKDNLIKRLIIYREQGDLCVTPLDILACHPCWEKIELLKATAADVNVTDNKKFTVLDRAIQHGEPEMVNLLLKHGGQSTEMYSGQRCGPVELVESLLMYGDNINFTHVPDCITNVFLLDEVHVELFKYFLINTDYSLDKCVAAINRILNFNIDSKLVRLFLCSGIRIEYLNDKYTKVCLPAKIYYFVRNCVAWMEKEEVRFVKIKADGEYVMEFCYISNLHRHLLDPVLGKFNRKSQMGLLDDCVKETEVMKSRRLADTRLTLLDLVEADLNQLVKYLGSNDLLYALEGEYNFSEFPICGEILKMHIDRGLKRRLLIDKCVQYFPSAYAGYPALPPEIVELIFNALHNRDLYAFSSACCSLL